jgi:mannitol-specific phosphotransferase system IIBC component
MEQPPPISELQSATPQPPPMSLPARLLNVLAGPGEVFDGIKASLPAASNWLVPVLLFALVGAISCFVMFSQPAIVQQIHEQQSKKMDEMVKAGKMSREQADQATAVAEKFTGPTMLMIFGSVMVTLISFVRVLWWALLLWLVGKVLKTPLGYVKSLEIFGLASMITVLGAVVGILLAMLLGRMIATPSLVLLVKDFDITRKTHLLLGTVNIFYFWQVGVLSVGVAKVTGVPFIRALLFVIICYVFTELLLIYTGLGQFAL